MIGDEVMFVTDTPTDAARIGLALAEAYADDELLSDVRVALAVGPVLVQDGDFYGPVVNLASRAVASPPRAACSSPTSSIPLSRAEMARNVGAGVGDAAGPGGGVRLQGPAAPVGEGPRSRPALGLSTARARSP
jgi:hypothetical protein